MHNPFSASRGRVLAGAVVVGAGLAASVAGSAIPATAASGTDAATPITVFSKFEARHSGQVMDVAAAATTEQGPVVQFPSHGGQNQQWTKTFVAPATSTTNTPFFTLTARHSGKCLDVAGGTSTAPSVPLVQATCDGTASQQWYTHKLADVGLLTPKGYRFVYNKNSGMVIDVGFASQTPGERLYQFPQKPLTQADNQLWNEDIGGFA